jgi:hypothetical protein
MNTNGPLPRQANNVSPFQMKSHSGHHFTKFNRNFAIPPTKSVSALQSVRSFSFAFFQHRRFMVPLQSIQKSDGSALGSGPSVFFVCIWLNQRILLHSTVHLANDLKAQNHTEEPCAISCEPQSPDRRLTMLKDPLLKPTEDQRMWTERNWNGKVNFRAKLSGPKGGRGPFDLEPNRQRNGKAERSAEE